MRRGATFGLFLLSLATAFDADAATIVVKKGSAVATIQAGINAAAANDTVLVMPGTYLETPVITAAKTGLVVRGKGKVVVDARDPDASADGAAFTIQADDVTLERMTIRHADFEVTEGHAVLAVADGLTLRNLTISHCSHFAVRVTGSLLTMTKCSIARGLGGVRVTGAQATIDACTFTHLQERAIEVDGEQLQVRKCVIRVCGTGGVFAANATSAHFTSNVVETVGGIAFEMTGTSITLSKNKVTGAEVGVELIGTSAVVDRNVVREVSDLGIAIDGLSALLVKNRVERSLGPGILVIGGSASFEGNTAARCEEFGIGLAGDSGSLTKNVAQDCCYGESSAGIEVLGASCSLQKNVARRCSDGIRINGNFAYLNGNVATNNAVDGFEVAGGMLITLEKNVALGNGAEGIDNEGASTTILDNVCKGNRIDIASAIAPQEFTGNVFGTGGPAQLPEID